MHRPEAQFGRNVIHVDEASTGAATTIPARKAAGDGVVLCGVVWCGVVLRCVVLCCDVLCCVV